MLSLTLLFNPFNTFFDKKLEFQNQSHRFARFSNSDPWVKVWAFLLFFWIRMISHRHFQVRRITHGIFVSMVVVEKIKINQYM